MVTSAEPAPPSRGEMPPPAIEWASTAGPVVEVTCDDVSATTAVSAPPLPGAEFTTPSLPSVIISVPPPPMEAAQAPTAPSPDTLMVAFLRTTAAFWASPEEAAAPAARWIRFTTPPPIAPPPPPPMLDATTPWALRPEVVTDVLVRLTAAVAPSPLAPVAPAWPTSRKMLWVSGSSEVFDFDWSPCWPVVMVRTRPPPPPTDWPMTPSAWARRWWRSRRRWSASPCRPGPPRRPCRRPRPRRRSRG